MEITLTNRITTIPDFNGFKFFVEEGEFFYPSDYAEAYGIDIEDLNQQAVKAAQNAAARLNPGEWLEISHEIDFDESETN